MANKYYLIPKDLYDGLIKTEPENQNIEFERRLLEKTKKIGKKDVKNVLYNQEMKRYLKLKTERDNKPVRVEIAKGAHLIIPPQPQLHRQPSHGSMASILRQYDQQDDDDDVFGTPVNVSRGTSQRSRRTSSSSASTENGGENPEPRYKHIFHQSPEKNYTSPASTSKQNQQFSPIGVPKNAALEPLYREISRNPNAYQVNDEGKIINSRNQPMGGSDLTKSLQWLSVPNNIAKNHPVQIYYILE